MAAQPAAFSCVVSVTSSAVPTLRRRRSSLTKKSCITPTFLPNIRLSRCCASAKTDRLVALPGNQQAAGAVLKRKGIIGIKHLTRRCRGCKGTQGRTAQLHPPAWLFVPPYPFASISIDNNSRAPPYKSR